MTEFTPSDANAVHAAMIRAKEEAANREDRMPSSARAFDQTANDLKVVRDKILDRLPSEFHEHRKAYPGYKPPADVADHTG